MKIKDISKFSTAEKIVLAEQLWDSISKKDITITEEIKKELDYRLNLVEEGKTEIYSWEEIKANLEKSRK
ncbi:addiction module protein [Flavobacterium sp.]|uniref:addiction module protein n=1 Tax=Flavobacterium sp. TaxID=239 RepID=UPI0025C67964|nr:addiction module protein [Flavobacterium sp.]MBA4152732.1 addiction module protein [Flavobacterium sp.]